MAKSIKETERLLRDPYFDPMSDQAYRVRRNLILVSAIIIAYHYSGINVDTFVVFGTKLQNLSERDVLTILHVLLSYFLIHFIWQTVDHVFEWRLRITGLKLAHTTGASWATEEGDYPDDPRKSTFGNWWADQANQLAHSKVSLDDTNASLQEIKKLFEGHPNGIPNNNLGTIGNSLNDAVGRFSDLRRTLEMTVKTIESTRIPASLNRYENWHKFVFKMQNVRFIILDFGFPVALALWAASPFLADLYASVVSRLA